MIQENNIDYIATFIKSSAYIFKEELNIRKLKRRDLSISQKPYLSFPILGLIGFWGQNLKGQIIYSVAMPFVKCITAKMLPNKLPNDRKKFEHSCLGELINMISGHATITLAGQDSIIHMTPPVIINQVEKSTKIDYLDAKNLVLLMDSSIGSIEINIGIKN